VKSVAKRIITIILVLVTLFISWIPTTTYAKPNKYPYSVEIKLFPAPEKYLMGGFPPGMTKQSFMAARGIMKLTYIDEQRTRLEFDFIGLIPNGVYTMWNVLSDVPDFEDEPLGSEGYGKHGVIADENGNAQAVVYLDKRPGKIFLLDYHSDGKLTGEKGKTVFPGALWSQFP
jgi:hypothetical protein